jgi:hypothetical protein
MEQMTMSPDVTAQSDPWAPGVRASNVPIVRLPAEPLIQKVPIPNKTDISAHLYALFDPAFVQTHPDAWFEIAYSDPATGDVNAARTFSVFDLEKAAEFAEKKNKDGCNLYVGPALRQGERPSRGRASDKDVVTSSHAWAEFDKDGDEARIGAILKANHLTPAMVVTTGTVPNLRAHLYFKLDGAVAPEKLRAVNTSLYQFLDSDAVHNNSRIMRLAGTVNYPPPKKQERGYVAELVTLHARPGARAYQSDELIRLVPTSGATSSDGFEGAKNDRRDDSELLALLEVSRTVGKWHTSMRDAIASMIGYGWSDLQIRLACAPYCTGGAHDPDLVPLIKGGRDKWDKSDERGKGDTGSEVSLSLGEWDAGEDDAPISPRGWLLGSIFCRRFISSLLGEGAVGKTALRYAQLLSLAIGRSLTGEHVFQRCRVLIVSMEDGADELRRRLKAARIHHGIELSELNGWLFLAAPGRAGGKLMMLDTHGRPVKGGLATKLDRTIAARKIDIVSLDPFVKTHSVEENNNSAIDDVIQILSDLGDKHDIAVDTPHHMAKGLPDPGNANRGRGASSMKDGGRLVYTVTKMTAEEAQTFGLSEAERRLLIRMDSGKVNIAPPADKATWFRLVGVRLDNGTELYPNGDEVQTVEPWTPPETFAGVTNLQINQILNDIEAGMPDGNRYTDASKATDRAAWRIIVKHIPEKNEGAARKIIKVWKESGLLTARDYENPATRKANKGLWVDNAKRPS